MVRRTLKALLATGLLMLLIPALAQASDPSLTGQTLAGAGGTNDFTQANCHLTGSGFNEGTFSYEGMTGLSGDPPLGTFTEKGSFSLDGEGHFTLLSADVKITSALGVVTIHKTGQPGPDGPGF